VSAHPALDAAHRAATAFLDSLAGRPVGARGDGAGLRGPLPEQGEAPERVIEALVAGAEDGLVASAGPRYFGFVMGGAVPSSVAADWLAAAWDQIAGTIEMSPAAAAAEETAGVWLLDLLSLPADASFGFPSGAQMANFTGLAAARHAVLDRAGWDVEDKGLQGAPLVRTIMGAESHATIPQALRYLGLGRPATVAADEQGRMRPEALAECLAAASGPAIVCAQAGNVDSGSSDPFEALADICAEHGAWLHVDGAFGLWAAASPALREQVRGVARADSWATDCHKWLNVPYDSAFVACAHPAAHRAAMTWQAAYVSPTDAREPYAFVPEASRRARAFAVWCALREMGREGVAAMIERCCANARRFAARLAAEPGVEVLNEVCLNQVLVRFADSDARNRDVMARVQAGGTAWLGSSVWRGRAALRISCTNWSTTPEDVDRSAAALLEAYRAGA
jgi:glutamate/tyrosine decarboxylase-like PLP-dependent enzyme